MFGGSWKEKSFEDLLKEDKSMGMSGADNSEARMRKWTRAQEIADGTVLGTFERDEEVWAMVKQIKNEEI